MDPPDIAKSVGRHKIKGNKEADEARKRKGEWSLPRRGISMTCSKCGEENHNARGCFKDGGESSTKRKQKGGSNNASSSTVGNDDWLEEYFNFDVATEAMTQESQQTFDSSQATTQQSQAYGPDIGHEEDPELRPKIVSESQTRLKARKLQVRPPTGTRRIQFIEGEDRVSMPTNLPYSPTKITWRGNAALTPSQLATQAIRKRIKIGSKWKEAVAPDSVRQ
ncbi:hypothetical protein RND71_042864 [Anisodus tanguticus]|uniref:Uncharacterized protein n=1 Tax=Anisodus tanguticus TaxID=243964 RepID=A0AAE1UPK1_9SOLA|nr:hypothetical protein RND71_042864 [Anisodus tanguticus]